MKSPNVVSTSTVRAPLGLRTSRPLGAVAILLAICPILFCSCQSSHSDGARGNNPYAQFEPQNAEEEAYYRDVYSGDWREQTDPTGMGKSIAKKSGSSKMPPHWAYMPRGAKTLEQIRAESSRKRTNVALNSGNPYPLPTVASQNDYATPQAPEPSYVTLEQPVAQQNQVYQELS